MALPRQNGDFKISSSGYTQAQSQAMQRAVINLFDKWNVKDADAAVLLGGINPKTLYRWKKGEYGKPTIDLKDRMSNLLGIHKALRLLFKDPSRSYSWITKSNKEFEGLSALEVMLNGKFTDLVRVRNYLDSQRG